MKLHVRNEIRRFGLSILGLLLLVGQSARGDANPSERDRFATIARQLDVAIDTNMVKVSPKERQSAPGAPRLSVHRMVCPELEIEAEQESGKIRWVANNVARRKADETTQQVKREGQKLLPTKTQDEAMKLAIAYAEKLGERITPDLILAGAGFREEEGEWGFGWLRHIGEYRFAEEGVSVCLADRTGELCLFNSSVTDKKCPIDVKITEEAATKAAEEHVKAILPTLAGGGSLTFKKVDKSSLQIVYPNTMHRERSATAPSDDALKSNTEPRLVYEVVFSFSDEAKGPIRRSRSPIALWIDAASGQVVGGK